MARTRPKTAKIYLGALLVFAGYSIRYLYSPEAAQCRSTVGQIEQSLLSSAQQNCSTLAVLSLVSVGLMLLGGMVVLVSIIAALKWRPPTQSGTG